MLQLGRKYSAGSSYRYGFNGKENDNEVKGEGNQQDYGMRIYDPRLGRFLCTDPITDRFPELTPYQFASNSPIWAIDLDGLEGLVATGTSQPFSNDSRPVGMIMTVQDAAKIDPRIRSLVADFTPFIGTIKGGVDAYNGYDCGTGDKLAGWQRVLNVIPFVSGFRKIGKVANAAEKISDASKVVNDVVKSEKAIVSTEKAIVNVEKSTSKIGSTGKVGEDYLKTLGGTPQKYFGKEFFSDLNSKGGRFVDQLVNGVAHESKVGYTTLTKDIREQIAKDAALLNNPESGIKKVVWNFFRSPETGKVGASKSLLKELEKAGIETRIIELPKK